MKKAPFSMHKDNNDGQDLGFGKSMGSTTRILNPDGSFNINRSGYNIKSWYQTLIDMDWPSFILFTFGFYLFVNILFGTLYYYISPNDIVGIEADTEFSRFMQCFFFSIQTYTTVGYGGMHPKGYFASSLAGIEALTGLMTFAIITGLVYAKFSKPKAKILFSENILVSPYQDKMSIQVRTANPKKNNLMDVEASMTVTFLPKGQTSGNKTFRTLNLEINKIVLFPLNWTLVHVMNESSPLTDFTFEDIQSQQVEILVFLRGYDDTYNQQVHSMRSYLAEEIIWNAKFEPMFAVENGQMQLYLDKIDNFKKLD
ncbi:MAG: ion channel [Saprospiraceae bacterium]|jgi:inward rectifier potassium channel|nr:ion transporter [Saprospiraceae bacterium]